MVTLKGTGPAWKGRATKESEFKIIYVYNGWP